MLGLMITLLGATPPIRRYAGMNQVYNVAQPAQNLTTVRYLGTLQTEEACQAKCIAASPRCWSYTFHSPALSSSFAGMCYGLTSPRWSPTPDDSLISSGKIEWPCRDDDDCSLNGKCAAGVCNCAPQWSGHRCETLNLLPATREAGQESHRTAHSPH
eukprot:6022277-Prymnesium_polylepis.1